MPLSARISLRQWLTIPYIALVTGLVLLIGALSYQAGSQAVDTVADHLLSETVARIGQTVDRHVVGSGATLEAAFPQGMAAPQRIEAEMATLRSRFWIATSLHLDPNNYVYYGNQSGQFFGLWRHSGTDGELRVKTKADAPREISRFTDINGTLGAPQRETRLYDPRERPWYQAAASRTSHIWTSIYIDFLTSELVATRARRVVNSTGELQGVVATDISLRRLNEFVRSLKTSEHALAFIIEPDGKLIASSRTANVKRNAAGAYERVYAEASGDDEQVAAYAHVKQTLKNAGALNAAVTGRFRGTQGEVVQLAFDRLRDDAGLDWITVVAVPRSDFMKGVTVNVQRTALIGGAAVLAALALGLGILGWISRDLKRLAAAAREVGAGRLDAPLNVYRSDELGDLATSFRQMQQALSTDVLTGLVNRDALLRSISARIEQHRRAADTHGFAVLFIDLDNFKQINDQFGHAAGDAALIQIGARLRAASRAGDLVARYAGDEFVMLVNNVNGLEAVEQVREKIQSVLRSGDAPTESTGSAELAMSQSGIATSGTVGAALYPNHGRTAAQILEHADADMYARKRGSGSEQPQPR
jgi:diguanylate cyclase (GGDEF)-like protein